MTVSRRQFLQSAASIGAAGLLAPTFVRPVLAQDNTLRIGWPAALTGAGSTPTQGIDRGMHYAVDMINAAAKPGTRKIELVTRDTQGDPTKAVNAVQEMLGSQKVHVIWGPANSGESLAVTPIIARRKLAHLQTGAADAIIDVKKYPLAFRFNPSNGQNDQAVRNYCTQILGAKKIAVIGDASGYGTTAVDYSVAALAKDGIEVSYQAKIDPTVTDVTPDMLHMRDSGAEVVIIWSVSLGLEARLMNTRARIGWDVPFVGHASMGSGDIAPLLEKPENWEKVYVIGYRSCSYDESGKLPERSQAFLDLAKGKLQFETTLLWWVFCGVDSVNLISKAVEESGSTDSEGIVKYWSSLTDYPGLLGDISWTADQHNGYPIDQIVMSKANSVRQGTFALAPGYK